MPPVFRRRAGVAVLEVHGVIGTRIGIPQYERLLDAVARSKRYRALLLDIDSPGGSASGSEVLYYSLKKVAERKPVVAYVRGIGASGAYYLCCAASRVTALPSALVGSIGVIYLRPVLEQLLGKVGVEFSVFKGGRLKDMSGFWRSPTAEEGEKFQGLIAEIYDNFVSVVAQGRAMEDSQVRQLATGEVFTAKRGKELGLVDDLGGFDQALATAAQLGRARPRPLWVRPRRSLSERLLGRVGSRQGGGSTLAGQLQRLLAGGIYYLEPSYLMGDYRHDEG
jgi:protease-4